MLLNFPLFKLTLAFRPQDLDSINASHDLFEGLDQKVVPKTGVNAYNNAKTGLKADLLSTVDKNQRVRKQSTHSNL